MQAAFIAWRVGVVQNKSLPLPTVIEPWYGFSRLHLRLDRRESCAVATVGRFSLPGRPAQIAGRWWIHTAEEIRLPGQHVWSLAERDLCFVAGERSELVSFGTSFHTELAGGPVVRYAGEIQFDRMGQLVRWSNDSGHYTPHPGLACLTYLPMNKFHPVHLSLLRKNRDATRETLDSELQFTPPQ